MDGDGHCGLAAVGQSRQRDSREASDGPGCRAGVRTAGCGLLAAGLGSWAGAMSHAMSHEAEA